MDRLARCTADIDAGLPDAAAIERIVRLLDGCSTEDAAWCVFLLGGGRPLRPAPTAAVIRQAAWRASGLPEWLFVSCLSAVGDLAETAALLPPEPADARVPAVSAWIRHTLHPLAGLSGQEQAERLMQAWCHLAGPCRELGIRLVTGRLRGLPATTLLQAAVAEHADLPAVVVAQRWSTWQGHRRPVDLGAWQALTAPVLPEEAPAPGRLAPWPVLDLPVPERAGRLGPTADWLAHPDPVGLPVRLTRRNGRTWLWSADEHLLNADHPRLVAAADDLPAQIELLGELVSEPVAERGSERIPERAAERAAQRTGQRLRLRDLLSCDGEDLRALPLTARRERLEALLARHVSPAWACVPIVPLGSWSDADGLLLCRRSSRADGLDGIAEPAWRLPAQPLLAQVLLLHAQAGTRRDAGLYTDLTLAVWSRPPRDATEAEAVIEAIAQQAPRDGSPGALELLPLTRATLTLTLSTDARARVDRLVRATTVARHGPVRSLRPGLVLSLAFEGIEANARRRSGVMLREPRVLGLLDEVSPLEASNLPALLAQADQRRTRFGCQ
ncbi:hypothetical protein [Sphaerotilus mobilis]|uniref:DNA ligase-1 n=1 Tax=Sphaerotilus mobilis TaxID=47994 RepID=A0A4Q7LRF2_9BURK|nr:hypothetical protein [Sphaerotilus mobilis]RZS56792.1 DNA ligase-1 [Sphaerotilus mobilis]